MTAVAAENGKFMLPDPNPRSPLSHLRYAYHIDATLYAKYLRGYAEKRGVSRIEGLVEEVSQNSETGDITGLKLEDGTEITGDFFFDCTGFRSLLTSKTLGVGFEDWSHWLPCDSAQTVASKREGELIPYTKATAKIAGWQRDAIWTNNCIALGLSAGFLEPLESTSIYLIQIGISRFISLFPSAGVSHVIRDEYNFQMRREFEQVRDFIILHYVATERDDSPFWNYCRTMSIPESLQLANVPIDQVNHSLESMKNAMQQVAHKMPPHAEFLKRIGAAI